MRIPKEAITALRLGSMVAIYDGDQREGETDLVFCAKHVSWQKIAQLRKDAGGLICLATNGYVAGKLGLPFFSDFVCAKNSAVKGMGCIKTAYGDKPAFSISINHRNVYTGITDKDRALTIRSFSELVSNGCSRKAFFNNFYTPGHVFLLIGSGIEKRRGHTELALELARMAGLPPAMVLCEMLDYGDALSKNKAAAYAKNNRIPFLEGADIYG